MLDLSGRAGDEAPFPSMECVLSTDELERVLGQIVGGVVAADLETAHLDFKRQPDSTPTAIRSLVDAAVCFAADSSSVSVTKCRGRAVGNRPTAALRL